MKERVYIFDTTLRDGAQTQGVDFSVVDKHDIAQALDKLGVDYIEGGWPGANPTDDMFFEETPKFAKTKLTAFGMTRRPNTSVENDPGLNALVNADTPAVCLVGKSWDFHVKAALGTTNKENIAMVGESIAYAVSKGKEVCFDAEHFFDGFKANPKFALAVAEAAYDNGARWVVLCDTNGGTMPGEIEEIIRKVETRVPGDHLGIHCHNDMELAVANSLAAVRAGARLVQGTLNGLGERCGNANLISIIPTLVLKMGFDVGIDNKKLRQLTKISRALDEKLNKQPNPYAPYVGISAFAHKGGLHVSGVAKDPSTYEHIDPALVGNERQVVVSNQAGRANILQRLQDIGIKVKVTDPKVAKLVSKIKEQEQQGYAYDGADASFEILARRTLDKVPVFFKMQHFRVTDDRKWNDEGELVTRSRARVTLLVKGKEIEAKARGNGPVNALDKAIRLGLADIYPQVSDIKLVDYKVRIINPELGTGAVVRVIIQSADKQGNRWSTVGVSPNVIDASYNALRDSITYKLLRQTSK